MTKQPEGERRVWAIVLGTLIAIVFAIYVGGYFWASEFDIRHGLWSDAYHRHFHFCGLRLAYRPLAWIESSIRGERVQITSDRASPGDYGDTFVP